MDDRQRAVIVAVLAAVTGIGGVLAFEAVTGSQLGSKPAASSPRGDVPGATASPPAASPSASALPVLSPTAKPNPKPSPTAAPPWKATWSKPRLVDKESCGEFAVAIDGRSRYHVVTPCDLRYSVTDGDGRWTTASLGDAKARGPLIAIDGNKAYVAYWRELPFDPDTCGGFQWAPSAGVYFRLRTLPGGAWSKAIPFGKTGDHLQAFRVDGGVLHAIVWNETSGRGRAVYIRSTQDPVDSTRHGIDADGGVSLRVGDDGRARIAYWAGGSLRYGTFDGSGFSTSKVANGPTDRSPMLVLGARNQPHVVYTIVPPTQGCGDGEILSRAGTYYATLVNGTWTSQRVTRKLGTPSIAVDPGTGRVHVLVENVLHTKNPGSGWVSARLPSGVGNPVMRLDPATGGLLVVYLHSNADGDPEGLYAITTR